MVNRCCKSWNHLIENGEALVPWKRLVENEEMRLYHGIVSSKMKRGIESMKPCRRKQKEALK